MSRDDPNSSDADHSANPNKADLRYEGYTRRVEGKFRSRHQDRRAGGSRHRSRRRAGGCIHGAHSLCLGPRIARPGVAADAGRRAGSRCFLYWAPLHPQRDAREPAAARWIAHDVRSCRAGGGGTRCARRAAHPCQLDGRPHLCAGLHYRWGPPVADGPAAPPRLRRAGCDPRPIHAGARPSAAHAPDARRRRSRHRRFSRRPKALAGGLRARGERIDRRPAARTCPSSSACLATGPPHGLRATPSWWSW